MKTFTVSLTITSDDDDHLLLDANVDVELANDVSEAGLNLLLRRLATTVQDKIKTEAAPDNEIIASTICT